jgi:hypothetical protein
MSEKLFGFEVDKQWDYENGFYLTGHPMRLPKILAQYELYKKIIGLPGHVVECGVYKGASFIRLASFRQVLESPYSRKLIGFDAFGKFPEQAEEDDAKFISEFEGNGGFGISEEEMHKVMDSKGYSHYELIRGDVTETIPEYIETHPELKIALLHVDVDVYKPTVSILENFYDRVVTGGLIVFDDYGTVAGETKAVDEFFAEKGLTVEKLGISHIPAFVVKK